MPTTAQPWGPTQGTENGQADDVFISLVRQKAGDVPKWRNDSFVGDGKSGAVGAGGLPLQSSFAPIWDDGSFQIRVSGTPQPIDSAGYPPGAGKSFVNYETGEIFLGTVPGAGAISWDYKYVKWRDQDISDALYAGLREMWPAIGKVYADETIVLQPLQWDYTLPAGAQDYWSKLLRVRYRTPNISVLPWSDLDQYEKVGNDRLHLPQGPNYFPGNLQITYWGPFQRLADVPPGAFWLPIWYALSTMLPWQETKRIKDDRAVAQQNEGGQQPGLLTQTGEYYFQRFTKALERLAQAGQPPGAKRRFVSRYDMNHSFRRG